MSISARLRQFLDEKGTKYVTVSHSRAYTSQEVAASLHVPGRELAKSVVVNADGGFALGVLPAPRRIDLGQLKKAVGARELRLATEAEFKSLFPDCETGAMPPFGNLYGLPVWADESLKDDAEIVFNAGSHTDTVRMSYKDFERLVAPTVANFAEGSA
jgi:Ala-tRNA(Pro) deacylase